jgi:Flp pilus assembly protein TadD
VAQTPDQVGNRPALALMFIQLKRYDLAERVLNEARRIRPDDPKVKDALELLASERAKG